MLFIRNLTKKKIDEIFLRSVEKKILRSLRLNSNIEISLVVCGEKRIRALNRAWRGKDRPTDVLAFGNQKSEFIAPPDNVMHLGQIFICYPIAKKQAREYNHSLNEEMGRLLVHGVLHLAGYDHERSKAAEKKMFGLQEKIVRKFSKSNYRQ